MAHFEEDRLRCDREVWQQTVKQILGDIPAEISGDDAERMASALRAVHALLERLDPEKGRGLAA